MSKKTFVLDQALKQWLKTYQKYQSYDEGHVLEIELHIRDHVSELTGEGLPEQEAFEKAIASFGAFEPVAKEEYWNQRRSNSWASVINTAIFKNYYRTSIRHLLRNPLSSFINVFGLAVAIGISMVVYVFYKFDYTIDHFHENKDQIFLLTNYVEREGTVTQYGTSPAPIGALLRDNFEDVINVCEVLDRPAIVVQKEEVYHESLRLVDPSFLEFFTFPLEHGSKENLSDPSQVILSASMASKYFGEANPIGQKLEIAIANGIKKTLIVGGVAAPFPEERTFSFSFLLHMDNIDWIDAGFDPASWKQERQATFVQMKPDSKLEDVLQSMDDFKQAQNAQNPDWPIRSFDFVSVAELHHASSQIENDISHDYNVEARIGMPIVAGLMLLLACINYMNIAISSAIKRLKEIGLRKVIGASRKQLVLQFLTENIVLTALALLIGLILASWVFVPWIIDLSGDPLVLSVFDPFLWVYSSGIVVITGLLSGFYPALYISKFQSKEIFQSTIKFGSSSGITQLFLGLQMVITCISITCAVVFSQNNDFQHNRSWGYDPSDMVYLKAPDSHGAQQLQALLDQHPDISTSVLSEQHVGVSQDDVVLHHRDTKHQVKMIAVGEGYVSHMGISLLNGSLPASQSTEALINEEMVAELGVSDPLGMHVLVDSVRYRIVGVVQDFHSYNFYHTIDPLLIASADTEAARILSIRTREGKQAEVFEELYSYWLEVYSNTPLQGGFQIDTWTGFFNALYKAEAFYRALAVITVLLAAMGIYGLVSLNIAGRKKEFSIRKVLGAESHHLMQNIGARYMILLGISLLLGIPASYQMAVAAMELLYAYPMPMTWTGLFWAVLTMCAVLLLVILSHLRNVSLANPVVGLRPD